MAKASKSLLCAVDVDTEATQSVCQKHGVSAMPTLVYIKSGKEADRMQGVDAGKLASWVDATA